MGNGANRQSSFWLRMVATNSTAVKTISESFPHHANTSGELVEDQQWASETLSYFLFFFFFAMTNTRQK